MEEIIQEYLVMLNAELELSKTYAEKYIESNVTDNSDVLIYKCMAAENLKHSKFIHDLIQKEMPAKYIPQWRKANEKYLVKVEIINAILK